MHVYLVNPKCIRRFYTLCYEHGLDKNVCCLANIKVLSTHDKTIHRGFNYDMKFKIRIYTLYFIFNLIVILLDTYTNYKVLITILTDVMQVFINKR